MARRKKKSKRSKTPTSRKSSHSKKKVEENKNNINHAVTFDGQKFDYETLPDMVDIYLHPSKWNVGVILTFLSVVVTTYCAFYSPPEYTIGLCVFWRLMYDIGLGVIMYYQSKHESLTRFVRRHLEKNTWFGRFVESSVRKATGDSSSNYPADFHAWIMFRSIVNLVLPNDVYAFCAAAARFGFFDEMKSDALNVNPYFAYGLGLVLVFLALISKKKSHDVIGAYAWFWGDHFILLDRDLIFDGIFEMCPHPMYSVGYAWYYGFALISQSYVVFGLALFSHLMQMAFLVFVETPHIEKIYGSPPNLASKSHSNIMLFRNFDIFRSSDLSLALVVCLTVALFVLGVDFKPLSRTCGGTQHNGEPCLDTPWTYRGNTYNVGKGTCILEDHAEWWCYTRKDLSAWGNCSCGHFGMYV